MKSASEIRVTLTGNLASLGTETPPEPRLGDSREGYKPLDLEIPITKPFQSVVHVEILFERHDTVPTPTTPNSLTTDPMNLLSATTSDKTLRRNH